VLFVDGKELEDVTYTGMDMGSNVLRFQLKRTPANKTIWSPILRNPAVETIRPLLISVGMQGGMPLPVDSAARGTRLVVLEWNYWTVLFAIVFVVLLVVFFVLATHSDVLKGPEPDADGRYPYSLSRTQAAVWLFLAALSFVFIWVVTGDLSTLNASVLALIGISAGTYLASAMIETPVQKPTGAQLPNPPPTPPPNPASSSPANPEPAQAAKPGNVQKAVNRIKNIRFVGKFLADILSDDRGISIPRFQIFVWTIVLGIIFGVSVVNELSMPEFSGTLLALMGISSATYVGAKLNQ